MENLRGQRMMSTSKTRRAATRAMFASLAALSLCAFGGPATAQDAAAEKTLTVTVSDAPLSNVVQQLTVRAGIPVIIQTGDKPFNLVTLNERQVTVDRALRDIAYSANAHLDRREDGTYLFSPKSAHPQDDTSYREAPAQPVKPAEPRQFYKISLNSGVPTRILHLLGWDSDNPSINPDLLTSPHIEAPKSPNSGPSITILQGNPNDTTPSVPLGRGRMSGGGANDTVITGGSNYAASNDDSANQGHQFGGGGFGGGGFGGGGGGFGGGGFGGGRPGGVGGANGQPQQLPEGVDKIYAVDSDNSILLFATPEGYKLVSQVLKYLDVRPRQVQIKVEFIQANINDVDNFLQSFFHNQGKVSVALTPISITDQTQTNNVFQYLTGSGTLQLLSTLTKTRQKLVNAPLIATTNNTTAQIASIDQIPFQKGGGTIVTPGGTTVTTAATQDYIQSTTQLSVLPRINGDDTVTLTLQPTISQPNLTGVSVGDLPPLNTKTLTTVRTVRNGETMVIGGLITKNESFETGGIPILNSLPLIGQFFRSRSRLVVDSELLIFVTPTIVGDDPNLPPDADTEGGNSNSGGSAPAANSVTIPPAGGAPTP